MTETETPEPRMLSDSLKVAIRAAFTELSGALPGFRPRRSQNVMVAQASRTLATSGARAVIEAPTGTGKSMAYLLAGIPTALAQGRTLVISTGTVALQEQVCKRDIPAFLSATGLAANVTLAKGRNRWACTHKLLEMHGGRASAQDELFEGAEPAAWTRPPAPGEAAIVEQLTESLLEHRWGGDLDNPPVPVPEALRPLLPMSPGGCIGKRCAFYRECPVKIARDDVRHADVIVTNHDLLMQSLRMEKMTGGAAPNFLSDPRRTLYVIDEGHGLGNAAVGASARSVHLSSAIKRLGRLRKLVAATYRLVGDEIARATEEQAVARVTDLLGAVEPFHAAMRSEWSPEPGARDATLRMPRGQLPDAWRAFADSCRHATLDLYTWLLTAQSDVAKLEDNPSSRDKLLQQLGMAAEAVDAQLQVWKAWSGREYEGPPVARWLSLGTDGGIVVHASDVTGAEFLRDTLWEMADSVVVTSATLSANGDFAFLADEIGAPSTTEYVSLPSPFDLEAQARLEVPAFPVLPNDPAHPQAIADWLVSGLDRSAGNLVLFTSRKKMLAVADALPPELRAVVKVQGERPKQAQIAEHTADIAAGRGSTLMGLISWGEGLDLPGELLTTVVVTQLPFSVPSDPIGATKAEWYESEGRNAFDDLAIPEAQRTLTQFVGRLIRRETDTGRVVILDRRLVQRRYGRRILDALPPFKRAIAA